MNRWMRTGIRMFSFTRMDVGMFIKRLILAVVVLSMCITQGCRSTKPVDPDIRRESKTAESRKTTSKKSSLSMPTLQLTAPRSSAGKPRKKRESKSYTQERSRTASTAYRLKPDDPIAIYLRGIPREEMIEDIIDEDGYINMPFINRVMAADKTSSELERDIRRKYLEGKIYKDVTVNVVSAMQSYYVRGEVRTPGRFKLMSGITLVQAVAAAGGYSEYANPRKIKVLRAGEYFIVDVRDLEKHPEKDIDVEPDDVIIIPRSVF